MTERNTFRTIVGALLPPICTTNAPTAITCSQQYGKELSLVMTSSPNVNSANQKVLRSALLPR
ncbi:MAG: hypothetical protein ACTS4U_01125 [Candidatus Hodgkinia cicadicola]